LPDIVFWLTYLGGLGLIALIIPGTSILSAVAVAALGVGWTAVWFGGLITGDDDSPDAEQTVPQERLRKVA
jgi:hypothetical protein